MLSHRKGCLSFLQIPHHTAFRGQWPETGKCSEVWGLPEPHLTPPLHASALYHWCFLHRKRDFPKSLTLGHVSHRASFSSVVIGSFFCSAHGKHLVAQQSGRELKRRDQEGREVNSTSGYTRVLMAGSSLPSWGPGEREVLPLTTSQAHDLIHSCSSPIGFSCGTGDTRASCEVLHP